ncbi:hypothetical protein B0H14DRAFT_3566659 [Mycena olivaceomarginata]|nr:hypothetical protein B0H14DRAFT_3566659 [Mycena olivaceomarginata]
MNQLMASRALSQNSKRDEHASSEGRWCSFAVALAPESGSERRMKTFAREEGKRKVEQGQVFCGPGMRLSKSYENAGIPKDIDVRVGGHWDSRSVGSKGDNIRVVLERGVSERRKFSCTIRRTGRHKITKEGNVAYEGLMEAGMHWEERLSAGSVGAGEKLRTRKRWCARLVEVGTARETGRAMDSGCNTKMKGKGAAMGQLVVSIMKRDSHCHRRHAVFAYVWEDGQSASMEG